MRRLMVFAVALSISATASSFADQVGNDTRFCDGKATKALGEGPFSQVAVHADVFAPAFAAKCPSERGLVSYLGTGDTSGVRVVTARTRDFGTADVAMSPLEKTQAEVNTRLWFSPVHQIPLYVDGWAVLYNLPCPGPQLKLSSSNLSLLYSGTITNWDDVRLQTDNAWLASCHETVRLVRRSDVAGATTVFQDYLSKENPQWNVYKQGAVGPRWPTGDFACAGQGDDGMINCISPLRGAIGYVGLAAAGSSGLPAAAIQNLTKSFVAPTSAGCTSAASAAVTSPGTEPISAGGRTVPWLPATMGDWSAVTITDAPDPLTGPKSYPICSFSYAYVLQAWYQGYGGTIGGSVTRAVVDYFTVALMDSTQTALSKAGYAALPPSVRSVARAGIQAVSYFSFTTAGI